MKERILKSIAAALFACSILAAMPVYNATSPAPIIYAGQTLNVWNAETPTPGNGTTAASQQLHLSALGPGTGGNGATPFSIDGKFSGAPGAFEVDVQAAGVDSDTNYQTVANGNITTADATNNTFHFDFSGGAVRYVRLLMRTRTNSVSITATISR